LQDEVARSADTAGLHAPVPALLLELQTLLGALSSTVVAATERGRRPFRPAEDWAPRLGELAYGVYLLADQTAVDVAEVVGVTAKRLEEQAEQAKEADQVGWPFEG
jgi:hypothetical protein